MKYIIDIEEKPLCVFDEDTQTYFPRVWRVKGFNSLVFDEEGLSRLEELNSDYINEHFSDLQDSAYKKGLHDGESKCGYCTEYQRGLEDGKKATFGLVADAFNADYQKGFEDGKAQSERGCEGCKYEANRELTCPCSECANNYKNKWTAQVDKIEVGDEVRRKSAPENEHGGIVTKDWENSCFIMWTDGSSGRWDKDKVVKTGRHFDIASILEEMQS